MANRDSDAARAEKPSKLNLMLRLGIWGAVLAAVAVPSTFFDASVPSPGQTCRTAFFAATAVAYLVVFLHCLVRLLYSRWPSWFLFTIGYGAMALAGVSGVVAASRFGQTPLVRDYLDLTRLGMVPMSSVVLLAAAYASRARARGNRFGSWKAYVKVILASLVLVVGWKFHAFDMIGNLIGATSINAWLAIEACSALSLAVLILRTRRIVLTNSDEIVVPTAHWAVAVLIGRAFSLVGYQLHTDMWWQIAGLELAGIAALLVGLGLANERAHRAASEKMAELQAMQQVSWSLVGAANIADLSSALAEAVSENFQASAAAIYLPGEKEDELVIAAVCGIDDPTVSVGKSCSMRPDRRRGFHSGHTARAYVSGMVQMTEDIYSDVEFLPWRSVAKENGIVVSVPLPFRERTIGVVNLFLAGVESLADAQVELLESIAAAASPSIENARLRSEISERIERAA